MPEAPLFYPVAVLALLIVGISKSGFGGGLGVLAVPLMSLAVTPPKAAAILLPLLIVMDLFTVWHYRTNWHRRNIAILLPGALFGIFLGSLLFSYLSEAHIRILIGLLAVGFVSNFFFNPLAQSGGRARLGSGLFWGTVAGFSSFGVHAGGPPVSIYLLPQQLPKSQFVGTTVIFFTAVNLVKLLPYTLLGQLNTDNLFISLILSPLAPLGVWLGMYLHRRINERLFYRSCYLFLLLTGLKLLHDGITTL
jgi:uncharacterized protein